MSDSRFYHLQAPLFAHLAALAGEAELVYGNPEHSLGDVETLECATSADMAFVRNQAYLQDMTTLDAGLCFCPPGLETKLKALGVHTIAISDNPDRAFLRAASGLVQPRALISPDEAISSKADIAKDAQISARACIGPGAIIGEGSRIGPGAIIGTGCVIGRNCSIGAGAAISYSIVGDGVDVRPGAVIGEAGLGVIGGDAGIQAMAHFGQVHIANGVRIGANSTIDRAVFGSTYIGARSQIDNLVHIAHNVQVGSDCVLAALCGVAGSTVLGNNVMMGGRAGIIDHIQIGDGVQIGAGALVTRNIGSGESWSGYPARPLRQYLREQAMLEKLAASRGGDDDA